jgi:hypothetical protein
VIAIDTDGFFYSLDRNDLAKRVQARALLRKLGLPPDDVV